MRDTPRRDRREVGSFAKRPDNILWVLVVFLDVVWALLSFAQSIGKVAKNRRLLANAHGPGNERAIKKTDMTE